MKVTSEYGQQSLRSIGYQPAPSSKETTDKVSEEQEKENSLWTEPDMDTLSDSLKSLSANQSEQSGAGNFKVKSSSPDNSVGELASMLARAETRMDVQQVASKAMRALPV